MNIFKFLVCFTLATVPLFLIQNRYSSKSFGMFLSGSYQCTLSYLNRNISLQILLVYLTSFLLGVDVACGITETCNLSEQMVVSEMNSIYFTLSFFCHLNFLVQKLYIVRPSWFYFISIMKTKIKKSHTSTIGFINITGLMKVSSRFNFRLNYRFSLLIPIRFFKGPFSSEILCAPASFFIYEKYAIFFEVVESLLYLLQSS